MKYKHNIKIKILIFKCDFFRVLHKNDRHDKTEKLLIALMKYPYT